MDDLEVIVGYLKELDSDFYGQVAIRFRAGRAVQIVEERSIKLAEHNEDLNGHDIHT